MSSKLVFLIRFLLSKLLRISFLCFYVLFINLFILAYFWREVTSFSHSQLQNTRYFQYFFTYFHINCYSLTLRFQLILYFLSYEPGRITNFSLDYSIFLKFIPFSIFPFSNYLYYTIVSRLYDIYSSAIKKTEVYVQCKSKLLQYLLRVCSSSDD